MMPASPSGDRGMRRSTSSLTLENEETRTPSDADVEVGNDSDYSSDSSLNAAAPAPALQPDGSWRQGGATSPRRRAAQQTGGSSTSESAFSARETLLGQAYRFTASHSRVEPTSDEAVGVASTDAESMDLQHLQGFVEYGAADLLSRSWNLLPTSEKTKVYPPFSVLPNCPNILEVRVTSTDEVSQFMCQTAVELADRYQAVTPVHWRALLVRSAVASDALRRGQGSGAQLPLPDSCLDAAWEAHCGACDADLNCDEAADGTADVNSVDFSVALGLSLAMETRASTRTLALLHQIVNKCIVRREYAVLQSWGVQRLNAALLSQVQELATTTTTTTAATASLTAEEQAWLGSAVGLAYKIAAASSNTDQVLSLLRFTYRHRSLLAGVTVAGVACLLDAVELASQEHVSPRPATTCPKSQQVVLPSTVAEPLLPLSHSLCVAGRDPDMKLIAATASGLVRLSLKAPYAVEARNAEFTAACVEGLVLDPAGTSLSCFFVSGDRSVLATLDAQSLEVLREVPVAAKDQPSASPMPASAGDGVFKVHVGEGRLVTPYYECMDLFADGPSGGVSHPRRRLRAPPLYATFSSVGPGSAVRGEVMPAFAETLSRECDSLSVQLYVRPLPSAVAAALSVVRVATASGRVWLEVEVTLQPSTGLMRVSFSHGSDTVAEVEEPMTPAASASSAGWTLWSATLTSVNEVAAWTIFRNGVQADARCRSGPLLRPGAGPVGLQMLHGTFAGQLAGLQVWSRAQSMSDMRVAAVEGAGRRGHGLLLSIPLDEGVGCYLHGTERALRWRGCGITWEPSPQPLPPAGLPSLARGGAVGEPRRRPWAPFPGEVFTVTSNGLDTLILQKGGVATWVNRDGQIVDQAMVKLDPEVEVPCYCPTVSKLYVVSAKEALSVRAMSLPGLSAQYLTGLASTACAGVASRDPGGESSSVSAPVAPTQVRAVELATLLASRMNRQLLADGDVDADAGSGAAGGAVMRAGRRLASEVLSLADTRTLSLRTVARLLCMCEELTSPPAAPDSRLSGTATPYEALLLCLCGRLLVRQVRLAERQCPGKVVPLIVATYARLRVLAGVDGGAERAGPSELVRCADLVGRDPLRAFLLEACTVFTHLNKVVLAECVSHDYQLKLITESADLRSVRQLLVPDNLPPLVASVIAKDLKKPFMTFLGQLKEQCEGEATTIIGGTTPDFRASEAMLAVLLAMLSQRERSQWHLVAVALVGSLTKAILRQFQQTFPSTAEQRGNLVLLKRTAVGVVLYPVAHYLFTMRLDAAVAASAVKVLGETRLALSPYAQLLPRSSPEPYELGSKVGAEEVVSITEVHTLSTPQQLRGPFTAQFQLQHAYRIRVEVTRSSVSGGSGAGVAGGAAAEAGAVGEAGTATAVSPPVAAAADESHTGRVHLSLIDNHYTRHAGSLTEGDITFPCGGRLFVECYPTHSGGGAGSGSGNSPRDVDTDDEGPAPVFSLVISAAVCMAVEETDWVREACLTLSHTMIRLTQASLLSTLPSGPGARPEPFLRGGLSPATLRASTPAAATATVSLSLSDEREDEEGAEVHRQLCTIAETDPSAVVPGDEDGVQAKLYKAWLDVFRAKHFPYADRLERVLRWSACAMVWHQLRPGAALAGGALRDAAAVTPALVKEFMKVLDWLRRKSFLLLEALQQGRAADMVDRARFLLMDVTPRCRAEAELAELQHTEEPVAAGGQVDRSLVGARMPRVVSGGTAHSFSRRSRLGGVSYRRPSVSGVDAVDMTLLSSRAGVSRRSTRGGASASTAVKLFSSGVRQEGDSVPGQLFDFLVNGSKGGSPGEMVARLYTRVTQAAAHTAAFKLQEELCRAYADSTEMISSILLSHLAYRRQVASVVASSASIGAGAAVDGTGGVSGGGAGASPTHGFGSHYAAHMFGCGLTREFDLQKAACSFVLTALRSVLRKLEYFSSQGGGSAAEAELPLTESLAMCAVLCHPWDSVDMSLLQPQVIFSFLRRLLSSALSRRLEAALSDDGAQHYTEAKGLLDLFHRCLIVPNSLLQVSVEGVRVVDGEVQGLHVENANVVCSARNHWKALRGNHKVLPRRGTECDLFANHGLPCVVTELPDALYFEITLDLSVHDSPNLAIGLSANALSPIDAVSEGVGVVSFSSSGYVHFLGRKPMRFSEPWQVGDVIGCGVFAPSNSVFFTCNGIFLGATEPCPFTTLIPFVEVRGSGSLLKVIVNFGEETPFKFDVATLHCSCRHDYLTSATVCDAAYMTVSYLVTQCYKNLSSVEADSATPAASRDAVSGLLERAASFLSATILELVELYRKQSTQHRAQAGQGAGGAPHRGRASGHGAVTDVDATGSDEGTPGVRLEEPLAVLIARLFHCVALVIECFRFDAVTPKTHAKVLQVCALTLTGSHDRWVKVRAAECLGRIRQVMREDYLAEATEAFKRMIPAEEVVQQLVELARSGLLRETEPPPPPPKWMGGSRVVRGKGVFFGSAPMPRKGTHTVGFRVRRRHQLGQGTGAPLGGCYYLGLCHGQPQITSMTSLIARTDVYVLQDTDDQDQVPHLLLKRQSIPRNSHRRIFGNDEVVWVQFNADQGEITFYRENMNLIGLAFANIKITDDLYPIVYHFNEDASCEIVAPPVSSDESTKQWKERLRRSIAVHTLQQLHMVGYFANAISQFIHRSITQLDRGLESCLVALSVLGGERSYQYCQHDTYGVVVVHAIADISGRAVVYLANDEERHLFSVPPQTLRPSFIQTPLYASGSPEADACASLLTTELNRSLYEASVVVPLLRQEREGRQRIETAFFQSLEDASTLDLMSLLSRTLRPAPAVAGRTSPAARSVGGRSPPVASSGSAAVGAAAPGLSTAALLPAGSLVGVPLYSSTGVRPIVRSLASMALLSNTDSLSSPQALSPQLSQTSATAPPYAIPVCQSRPASILTEEAVVVDRQRSTRSVYSPNPSIAVTTAARGCSTIRASAVLRNKWSMAVVIAQHPSPAAAAASARGGPATGFRHGVGLDSGVGATGGATGGASVMSGFDDGSLWNHHGLLYVGLTSSSTRLAELVDDVQGWEDAWALCNVDSARTNSVNCSVEPTMIFGGAGVLYGSGDILVLDVDRTEGTVAFSRVRRGKRVSLGVLFEGVPMDEVLRPFVVCGPESVVVFSFLGAAMFPARNTFPVSNFTSAALDVAQCVVCEGALQPPWYGGEDGVALCEFCFQTWQHPKELFYVVRAPTSGLSEAPLYLVSTHVPAELRVGTFVEFEENAVPAWSARKGVNVEATPTGTAVSVFEEAFAVTEPLSIYGSVRVDVQVGHIAGAPGCPFSGLLPFVPLWRDEQQTRTTCIVQGESLVISASVIPANTKTMFTINISDGKPNQPVALTSVFIGVTNLSDTAYTVTRAGLDRLCANNNVWGSACDSADKVAADGTVYVLVDTIQGTLMLSSSLCGLLSSPFVITCSVCLSGDAEESLRLVLFSHETCRVTSTEGLTSCGEAAQPTFAPVAVGLVPADTFGSPVQDVFADAIVAMDTVQQTYGLADVTAAAGEWTFTSHAITGCDGVLFNVGDTVTFILEQHGTASDHDAVGGVGLSSLSSRPGRAMVRMFSQGVLVAYRELTRAEAQRRYRFAVYLSARGLTATFVPPVYGRTRLGRIVSVHGGEVGVVESCSEGRGTAERFPVRRKDVRYCALAASSLRDPGAALREGTHVAFRMAPIQPPKRGSVMSFASNMVTVFENDNDRTVTHLTLDQCFVLDNEGAHATHQALYPLVTPPTSTILKLFEVGKNKYRLQSKGSYNGIVFDCKTSDTVELVGLSVLSHTSGRHRADVFFKKGSHRNYERDSRSWTSIFSGFVDMHVERQFSVNFSSIYIEAGTTFAIYVNTSHNCGVGFYCEDDGCQGEVGSELDTDGTITVSLGRKSGSSSAFGDFSLSPRGFCGTIAYKQSRGSKAPLIEGDSRSNGAIGNAGDTGTGSSPTSVSAGAVATAAPPLAGVGRLAMRMAPSCPRIESLRLISRPVSTRRSPCVWFTVEVGSSPVRIASMRLPVVLETRYDEDGDMGGSAAAPACLGLLHCVVSLLFCPLPADMTDAALPAAGEGTQTAGADAPGEAPLVPLVGEEPCGSWSWAWNSRVLVDAVAAEVEVGGLDIHLAPGKYHFAAVARDLLGEHANDCSLQLASAADPAYSRSNNLITVKGFYGIIVAEADAPTMAGDLHTMSTGAFLNQSNSASYNGIMFDIRSKQDVTLEEIFCVSQTSAENVAVRLFWKEGSMEGAEKSAIQWREVAAKEMQLVDKQPFSVGSVYLRMKANQMYSLFINTSSSCGVRFYNSSDGHVGDIGDEFESDGTLSIYVGRKSESATPFAEIPMEPRAFRGKIVYRTYASSDTEMLDHAMLSYFRAYVVTRILVALSSYVDSSALSSSSTPAPAASLSASSPAASAAPRFSYEALLSVVSTLATSPCRSIADLIGAENLLASVMKESSPSDLRSGLVTIPLAPGRLAATPSVSVGDLVKCVTSKDLGLITGFEPDDRTATVRLLRDGASELVGRRAEGAAAGGTKVSLPVRALLPLAKCWQCQLPHATRVVCPVTGQSHRPPPSEEHRLATIIANTVMRKHAVGPADAFALAKGLLSHPERSIRDAVLPPAEHATTSMDTPADVTAVASASAPQGCKLLLRTTRPASPEPSEGVGSVPDRRTLRESGALFTVPTGMLLQEEAETIECSFTCPLVHHEMMDAYVSLRFTPTATGITVGFITDRPLRRGLHERGAPPEEAYVLQLYALQDPQPLISGHRPGKDVMEFDCDVDELTRSTSAVALLASPFVYVACTLGKFLETILDTPLTASACSLFSRAGAVHFALLLRRVTLPPLTPVIVPPPGVWCWEAGGVEAHLSSTVPTFLRGSFTPATWTKGRPRCCSLMVVPKGNDKTVFLEAHVVFKILRGPSLWDSSPTTVVKTLVRKPFNLGSGEVVTLGYSTDGDLFICDAEDVVRCHISASELALPPHHARETVQQMVGFVSVDQEGVVAHLAVLEHGRRTTRPLYAPEIRGGGAGSAHDDLYEPVWRMFDTRRVASSRNGLVAACCSDVGGQAVLGSAMRDSGVCAFIVQVERRDREKGAPLGSGHFAGIAISGFPQLAPHYGEMKNLGAVVWAVQDVQDGDSLPGQAPIPPMEREGEKGIELFCCGTRLLFIVDRAAGTLSLAREHESPRIIFNGIPREAVLCPFVRLDHTASFATLSRFSPSRLSNNTRVLYQPSVDRTTLTQPITASFLRRFPFAMVLKLFPPMLRLVSVLPSPKAARLEKHWSDVSVRSRFQYRLARGLDMMVEMGAFGRDMIECDSGKVGELFASAEMQAVVQSLAVIPDAEVVALPLPPSSSVARAGGVAGASPTLTSASRAQSPVSGPAVAGLAHPEEGAGAASATSPRGQHVPPVEHRRTRSLFGSFGDFSKGTLSAPQLPAVPDLPAEPPLPVPLVYFRVPAEYEVVGRVPGAPMIRLMHMSTESGPVERTLHLVPLDDPSCALRMGNEVLAHPSAMRQCETLAPLNSHPVIGVITEGWFDCTLEDLWAADAAGGGLAASEERKVAASLLCGVEHWHLHGTPHGHIHPANVYLRITNDTVVRCAIWTRHVLERSSPYASLGLRERGTRDLAGDLGSCAALLRRFRSTVYRENASLLRCADMLERPRADISRVLQESEIFGDASASDAGGEGPSFTLRTGVRLRGGSGSYNGIMFDVVAKNTTVRLTKIGFVPDTNATAMVTLYARFGSFLGVENTPSAWEKILEVEMLLSDNQESFLEGFEPLTVPAGSRTGLFLHTTNSSGVLFYSENEGVVAAMGQVEEENNDIGITIGKKSESSRPFMAIQNQKRLLKGSITYMLITHSNGPRSSLIYSNDARPITMSVSGEAGPSVGVRSSPTDTPTTLVAADTLEPVLVFSGHASQPTPGLRLPAFTAGEFSLVSVQPGQLMWVPDTDVCSARCPVLQSRTDAVSHMERAEESASRGQQSTNPSFAEWSDTTAPAVSTLDAEAVAVVNSLESAIATGLRARYYRQMVRDRQRGSCWPALRPLAFTRGQRLSGVAEPHTTLWLSERLDGPCTVSVWIAPHTHTEVYVQFDLCCPAQEAEGLATPSLSDALGAADQAAVLSDNLATSDGAVLLFFDPVRRCVRASGGGFVRWPAGAAATARVVAREVGRRGASRARAARTYAPLTDAVCADVASGDGEGVSPSAGVLTPTVPGPTVIAAVATPRGAAFSAFVSYEEGPQTQPSGLGETGLAETSSELDLGEWSSIRITDGLTVVRPREGVPVTVGVSSIATVSHTEEKDGTRVAFDTLYGGALCANVIAYGDASAPEAEEGGPLDGPRSGQQLSQAAVMTWQSVASTAKGSVVTVRGRAPLLVETSRPSQWTSVLADLTFASHAPSLDVSSHSVTQVVYSAASNCVVLNPSFTPSDIHEVVLRVSCPRRRLVGLALEPASMPTESAPIPLSAFSSFGDELYGSPQQLDMVVRLHIDLSARLALVRCSTGAFLNVFHSLPTAATATSEVRLTITLMAPGSTVEVTSWQRRTAQTGTTLSPGRFALVAAGLDEEALSSNVAPTVGVLTRHSSRNPPVSPTAAATAAVRHGGAAAGDGGSDGSGAASAPTEQSAMKQMEVLIVSYARLLLEKALIAQDSAREAVQRQLHTLLSYTSLRSNAAVATVLEREFRQGAYYLVAQSCAHLLAPAFSQTTPGVETSVNVLIHSMNHDAVKSALHTPLGATLTLALLRTATIYTRTVRHKALRCAHQLLSNPLVPLPTHELLVAHLSPLLRMMSGLCQQGKTSSAVVQIGVTLIADLISMYQQCRPGLVAPGMRTSIPFPVVICARAVIDAITHNPPLPLPAALTKEQVATHRILWKIVSRPPANPPNPSTLLGQQQQQQQMQSVRATFSESSRELATTKTFEVLIGSSRKGAIVVGWDLDSAGVASPAASAQVSTAGANPAGAFGEEAVPLPSCGYYIEPHVGKVYVCLGRKKEEQPVKVKARAGDVIVVTCSYKQPRVQLILRRGGNKEITTSFQPNADEHLGLPFYFAQHKTDAEPNFKNLTSGSMNINVSQMYADLCASPDIRDSVQGQSYDFYTELNLFTQVVLGSEKALRAATETVATHETAGFALLSGFLGAGAFVDAVPLEPLVPYLKRLQLFDALTVAFTPLINLQRKSELFDIFRVLKNLCSKGTEENIQAEVMRPFQNRPGRKAHVTIHTMQAQPSATLGPYQTLMRSVFGQLYLQLQRSGVDTFYVSPIFTVKLAGFGSTDAGGPYRDVLSQLATEIMTPHPGNEFQLNPLFVQCGRGGVNAIMPNANLMSSSQTPMMLEFFGKLLASFFVTTDLLAVEFPPLFWKLLLNERTTVKDLTVLDPDTARELAPDELMDRTGEELEERFPGIGALWRGIAEDCPHLRLDPTLPPTTVDGARLLSDRIVESEINRFAEAIGYIQQGFGAVIPLYTLQAFRWQKVELLICGTRKLSFEAFKSVCDIQLPPNEAASFLSVLEAMSDEDRTLLLRFTTGQSSLPLKSRIKVQHTGSKNSLPTSSTCFFTLRLPSYTTDELMRERMLYAIRQCKAIDADGQARENLIFDG